MKDFLQMLAHAFADDTFVSLTLSKPGGAPYEGRADRITVRPVDIRGERMFQWTRHFPKRETHENLDSGETVEFVGMGLAGLYRRAHLFTTEADLEVRVGSSGDCHVTLKPPTKRRTVSTAHNRVKQHLIPEGRPCPFLHELGVMTPMGRVHRSKQDKFRQINRFLEFVHDVLPHLPVTGPLVVVDFGCGLSYLTFALHHLLTGIHGRDVHMLGIDQNPQVIQRCTETRDALRLEGLEFVAGSITEMPPRKVHLAIALHACDTATDDALAQAVRWEVDAILAAPCCQHELAPQLHSDALALLTRHGILRERLAAMATDALRAAVLEQAGYRTDVIEFIDTEHTPKNLLLRAIRRSQPSPSRPTESRIDEFKALLGTDRVRLADLLSDRLTEERDSGERGSPSGERGSPSGERGSPSGERGT
jgi:hypothetical protein